MVLEVLGRQAFAAIGKLKLAQWLAEQEELHQVVFYLADPIKSLWTFRCIRQADLILFVAIPDIEVEPSWVAWRSGYTQQDNGEQEGIGAIAHFKHHPPFTGTLEFWSRAVWHLFAIASCCCARFERLLRHQRIGKKLYGEGKSWMIRCCRVWGLYQVWCLKKHLFDWIDNLKHSFVDFENFNKRHKRSSVDQHLLDFARLARHLLGRSIGLVLGGGGARGIAQLGIIKAFQEAGIMDVVGGTSIGSFVGAFGRILRLLVDGETF